MKSHLSLLACLAFASTLAASQVPWEPEFTGNFAATGSGPGDTTPEIAHPSEGLTGFYTDAPSYLPTDTVHVFGNWVHEVGGGA